jgi:hypothetical protein
MMHTCDVIIHTPHAVRKFGEICDWCRATVGEKAVTWSYEILEPQKAPWRIRFHFRDRSALIQFQVTWCGVF